jgi:hypothetical protein
MFKVLLVFLFLPSVLLSNDLICQSPKDLGGHLGFSFTSQGLILKSCTTKQQICNDVEFEHLENHIFETSGSFIFNGSHSETLIFDGTFERLVVKTDYALSRSGDRLKSNDIQAQFVCQIANSI